MNKNVGIDKQDNEAEQSAELACFSFGNKELKRVKNKLTFIAQMCYDCNVFLQDVN